MGERWTFGVRTFDFGSLAKNHNSLTYIKQIILCIIQSYLRDISGCRHTCDLIESCLFYQLNDDQTSCFLCLTQRQDLVGNGLQTNSTTEHPSPTIQIQLNSKHPYILLNSTDCTLGPFGGEINTNRFERRVTGSQSRITAIDVCKTGFGALSTVAAGYQLYIDNQPQPTIGCNTAGYFPYGMIRFAENEIVNRIDIYTDFPAYNVVGALTFYTNMATYGPFGDVENSRGLEVVRGYNLLGFYGQSATAIKTMGVYFERC